MRLVLTCTIVALCACAGRSPGASSACGLAVERRAAQGKALVWIDGASIGAAADADNARVVLFSLGEDARVLRSIDTRAAPSQLLFDAAGRMLVVERAAGTVSAYDPCEGRRIASARVAGDPVAIAIAPDHATLYLVSSWTRTLSVLDAATLETVSTIELARDPRSIAIDGEGKRLYVTHLAGAPLTVIELGGAEPRPTELPPLALPPLEVEEIAHAESSAYGAPLRSRMTIDHIADVEQRLSQAWTAAVDASGRAAVPLVINRPDQRRVRMRDAGYGGAEDGELANTTSFGLVVWDPSTSRWSLAFPLQASDLGTRVRIPSAVATDAITQTLYVASTGTSEIAVVRPGRGAPVEVEMIPTIPFPSALAVTRDGELIALSQIEHAIEFGPRNARRRLSIGSDPLPADVSRGRRLFYTANDAALSSIGLACAGCHPDGHDDGLVWSLQFERLQTPTLRGRLTAPYQWQGQAPTLPESIAGTVQRIGGTGITWRRIDDLAAYIERGLLPPPELGRPLTPLEARGRDIFHGRGACVGCHAPDDYADGELWVLDYGSGAFDTPSLRGVGSTAPYFHDGRYATLTELLERAPMGGLRRIDAEERRALEAFLLTL